jgi:hypothetical protein
MRPGLLLQRPVPGRAVRPRPPARGRAVRPREAATARRTGLPRLPTRGRAVRPREATPARRDRSPREPACLLRLLRLACYLLSLQISRGTLAAAASRRDSFARKGWERKDKGHSGLLSLFIFSQSFFWPKCFNN